MHKQFLVLIDGRPDTLRMGEIRDGEKIEYRADSAGVAVHIPFGLDRYPRETKIKASGHEIIINQNQQPWKKK